jgi:hypothetical protein
MACAGAQLPLVFARTKMWFTAGPTTYEFDIVLGVPPLAAPAIKHMDTGSMTIG